MSLQETDPEIFALIEEEKERQVHGIELIASEVGHSEIHNPQPIVVELHVCGGAGSCGLVSDQQVLRR